LFYKTVETFKTVSKLFETVSFQFRFVVRTVQYEQTAVGLYN